MFSSPPPALMPLLCPAGKIPEEAKALSLLAPATPVASLMPGGGLLPIPTPTPLQNVSYSFSLHFALRLSLDVSDASIVSLCHVNLAVFSDNNGQYCPFKDAVGFSALMTFTFIVFESHILVEPSCTVPQTILHSSRTV